MYMYVKNYRRRWRLKAVADSVDVRCSDIECYRPKLVLVLGTFSVSVNCIVRDSKGTDGACYKRDVRRSQHPRLSDWLVANGGVTEIASLQIARFLGFWGRLVR